jgi:DNA ligase-1
LKALVSNFLETKFLYRVSLKILNQFNLFLQKSDSTTYIYKVFNSYIVERNNLLIDNENKHHYPYTGPVLLAKSYSEKINPIGWWASEKFDGYRGLWTGEKLMTRNHNEIIYPKFFKKYLPDGIALDGELWLGRGNFHLCGLFRKKSLTEEDIKSWKTVKYLVFDAPGMKNIPFEERQKFLQQFNRGPVEVVKQIKIESKEQLKQFMKTILDNQGEGVMLRKPGSFYEGKRSSTLLKLKLTEDLECTIVGYKPGKGKYENLLGSFICKIENGTEFFVSGFDDEIRKNYKKTHPIGTIITVEFKGWTQNNVPRHPVYVRKYIQN